MEKPEFLIRVESKFRFVSSLLSGDNSVILGVNPRVCEHLKEIMSAISRRLRDRCEARLKTTDLL